MELKFLFCKEISSSTDSVNNCRQHKVKGTDKTTGTKETKRNNNSSKNITNSDNGKKQKQK